ncbi:CLAVATA3/ESR (CLE)-related protein 12 [Mangifera indica]|uniref:CLAVATA3/ESR (CLE)-related protein 12 n=1 Tax=Mangifera indica TaxID=29780 RepID=UPI001CFA4724|nr:CLAVATA3/ESR (CLE)-related protein 12 [Mangifera indica]
MKLKNTHISTHLTFLFISSFFNFDYSSSCHIIFQAFQLINSFLALSKLVIYYFSIHFLAPCFLFQPFFSHSFSTSMALKFSHLVFITLWLSLLLFLMLHELYNFKSRNIHIYKQSSSSNIITASSSSLVRLSRYPLVNRKVLASKFDFTPFQKHGQHEKHKRSANDKKGRSAQPAAETQIDPRYGVEKRLVPTGPNPLHH